MKKEARWERKEVYYNSRGAMSIGRRLCWLDRGSSMSEDSGGAMGDDARKFINGKISERARSAQ
jgi:hypothetical protein